MLNLFLLLFCTLIWGIAFICQKWTLESYSPLWSTTIRYFFTMIPAGISLCYFKSFKRDLKDFKAPFICAVFIFIGFLAQNIGLKYTTVAKSSFITTFYAFFTPLWMFFYHKMRFRLGYWFLLSLAIVGIFFLCDLTLSEFNKGDVMTLVCALSFSAHIIIVGNMSKNYPSSIEFNSLQCFFVFIFSIITGFMLEPIPSLTPLLDVSWAQNAFWGFIVLGIFSSFVALTLQVRAQKQIPPHVVSMIFLMESPFATIFAYFILGEMLTLWGLIGALMVMVAVALLPKVSLPA
ncbi:MAG: DMT family transporter [Bacteriovoracaceae bacterium]|nr:DMT family transporter [Bacteriovoracaceae bacterium]